MKSFAQMMPGLALCLLLALSPDIATAQLGGGGGGGGPGGGPGGGSGPVFVIDNFELAAAQRVAYKKLKVTFYITTIYDRDYVNPKYFPNIKTRQGILHGEKADMVPDPKDMIPNVQYDMTLNLPSDEGQFSVIFHWIDDLAVTDPNEANERVYTITINADKSVTIHPAVAQGTGSHAIGGTKGEPVPDCGCESCVTEGLGANNASSPAKKSYAATNLNLRQKPDGCSSCGSGGVGLGSDELDYQLSFQPYNFIFDGSFGPGIYLPYDNAGYAFEPNEEFPACRIFDVRLDRAVTFLDDEHGSTGGDGLLHDENGYFKHAKLIGGNTLASATAIEVEQHNGIRFVYDLFDWAGTEGGNVSWIDRDLRLAKVIDRNGRETVLAYSADTNRYDSVTHWNGEVITLLYPPAADPEFPAISLTIGGSTYTVTHGANRMVDHIEGPDGWFWSNTVSGDPVKQTTVFTITDPAHGQRDFHGANDFMHYNGAIVSQPTAYLKEIIDDAGLTVLKLIPQFDAAGTYVAQYAGNKTARFVDGEYVAYLDTGGYESTFNENTFDFSGLGGGPGGGGGTIDPQRALMLGAPSKSKDIYGDQFDYEYDSDLSLVKKLYYDGSSGGGASADRTFEEFDRNGFKQLIRYRDRLGNVTLYEFDGNGNLLKRKVGLVESGGIDVPQPEYAEYLFDYNIKGLLRHTYQAEFNAVTPDLFVTEYQYDANNRLHKVIEAADTSGGNRAETVYTYGTDGLVDQVESPSHIVGQSRIVQYEHNGFGAIVRKTYHDLSTERWIYDATGPDKGRMTRYKDRMGVVTRYEYDSQGRRTRVTVNYEHMADNGTITAVNNPLVQQVTTYQYIAGTRIVSSSTTDGKKSDQTYDYRHRVAQSDTYPAGTIGGSAGLSRSITKYHNNRVFYTEDTFGRRNYRAYSATNPGEMIRTVQVTVPHTETAIVDSDDVLALNRNSGPVNGRFLINDAIRDAGGNITEMIDPLGTITKYKHNSRGSENWNKAAFGTAIEAKTESEYDKDGRVVLVRSPRYFDTGDPEAANMYSTFEYSGRGLQSRTLMTGSFVQDELTYNPDQTTHSRVDANGESWLSFYHSCCGRLLGSRDPLGHGGFSNTDRNGRVTHTAVVEDYDSHTTSHNPVDNLTMLESTTRYDALGRVIYQTQWLVPQGEVDSENPPIAGLDGVAAADGITTQTLYDNDLTDGIGFDGTGITVQDFENGTSYALSLANCLAKLSDTTANGGAETTFQAGAAGSAVVRVNGQGEIQASVSDATGRSVMAAQLAPNTGSLITWSCTQYDTMTSIDVAGTLTGMLEIRQIDPEGNIIRSITDGGGRVFQSIDATGEIATASFDAVGNVLSHRDSNGVGADLVYDALGRLSTLTDTWNTTSSVHYDREGNSVERIDRKGKSVLTTFDRFNRRVEIKGRLHNASTPGKTVYTYTAAGQLATVVDAEGAHTSYAYNDRGEKISVTNPDHIRGSTVGTTGYGIVEFLYDAAGRLEQKTDQAGNTSTFVYDLIGRMTSRDYRDLANSPSGTTADSNTYSYDLAGRPLTATSGRYNNVVTMTYDNAGRLSTENLNIDSKNYAVTRGYDSRGQLSSLTYPDGSMVERNLDARRQLKEVRYQGAIVDTRTYDAGGRLDTSTYGNSTINDYDYRDNGSGQRDNLLQQIVTTNSGAQKVGNYAYTWDANGNKTSETISGAGFMSGYGFSTSQYDDDDRLTGWNRTDGNKDQSWNLSLVGDWSSFTEEASVQTRTHNAVHEISDVGGNALATDNRGNITSIPASVQTNGQSLTMSWDMDSRLASVNDGGTDLFASYDALGRRVKWGQTATPTIYVYSGQQMIATYNPGAAAGSPLQKWVYGSYIDEPIMTDRYASGEWKEYYYHRNQQYSVTALTDEFGLVVERYAYDAYGNSKIMSVTGATRNWSAYRNNFMYTGRFYHSGFDMYYFRARMYSPGLGRFVSRDPLGFVDGMSLYRGYFAPGLVDPGGLVALFNDENPVGYHRRRNKPAPVETGTFSTTKCTGSVNAYFDITTSRKKKNGKYEYRTDVKSMAKTDFVQLEFLVSPQMNCCKCNWVQFVHSHIFDDANNIVALRGTHKRFRLHHGPWAQLDEWYVDAGIPGDPRYFSPWYEDYGKSNRTPSEVSIFDNPTVPEWLFKKRWDFYRFKRSTFYADAYLVCNGKPVFNVAYEKVCIHQGGMKADNIKCEYKLRKFGPTNKMMFGDSDTWSPGYPDRTGELSEFPNPLK